MAGLTNVARKLFPYRCISIKLDGKLCTNKVDGPARRCESCWLELAQCDDISVRIQLAQEKHLPSTVRMQLLHDTGLAVRLQLAKRADLSPDEQQVLVQSSVTVLRELAANRHLDKAVRSALMQCDDDIVQAQLRMNAFFYEDETPPPATTPVAPEPVSLPEDEPLIAFLDDQATVVANTPTNPTTLLDLLGDVVEAPGSERVQEPEVAQEPAQTTAPAPQEPTIDLYEQLIRHNTNNGQPSEA